MRKGRGIAVVLGSLLALWGCGSEGEAVRGRLTVFAAASTTDVMTELGRLYTEQTGVDVRLSLAASSTLARQIEAGAPFDVFLSANPRWMDHVEGAGLVRSDSRRDLLGNTLVLVAPHGRTFAVEPRPGFPVAEAFDGPFALGDPAHVPAGLYAREALERLGWWPPLKGRIVPAATVRAALRLVELGEAGAGVVYRTDAAVSERVAIVAEIPSSFTPPIVYPIGLSREAGPEADAFLRFLGSPTARAVFERAGFRWLGSD